MRSGKCGVQTYPNITQQKMNFILNALSNDGATVTGSNPWFVDTHKFGVRLEGNWNEDTHILTIIVTDKNFLIPCTQIWNSIDPLLQQV
jgi:hypothetical protein